MKQHQLIQQDNAIVEPIKKLRQDAERFFNGSEESCVGYAIYGAPTWQNDQVQGSIAWYDVQQSPNYYLSREEVFILQTITNEFERTEFHAYNLGDLGPGDQQALRSKALPLLKALHAKKYIAYDVNQHYAAQAAKIISEHGIKSGFHITNFFDESLPKQNANTLLFMAGGTITNISAVKNLSLYLSSVLLKFRRAVMPKTYFLVSFDANQNEASLHYSYRDCVPINRLFEDALWRIQRDTDFKLEPHDFVYHGQWLAQEHRYAHFVRAQRATTVIRPDGQKIHIPQGQCLHVENSYKFPPHLMEQAAANAGWKTKKIWTETGRVHYILFEAI